MGALADSYYEYLLKVRDCHVHTMVVRHLQKVCATSKGAHCRPGPSNFLTFLNLLFVA